MDVEDGKWNCMVLPMFAGWVWPDDDDLKSAFGSDISTTFRILRHINTGYMVIRSSTCGETEEPLPSDTESKANNMVSSTLSFAASFAAGMLLTDSSFITSGLGALVATGAFLPAVHAHDGCNEEVLLEIHGPPTMGDEELTAKVAELEAKNAELTAQLEGSITVEESEQNMFDLLVDEIAFQDYVRTTPKSDHFLGRLSNDGSAQYYNKAGLPILGRYNPEPAFYLKNADDDSLLRNM